MGKTKLKEQIFPLHTLIGGWYIPEQLCDELIQYYEQNKKYAVQGRLGKGGKKGSVDLEIKDSYDLSIGCKNFDVCIDKYRTELQNVLEKYLKKFNQADNVAPFNIITDYNIQKYAPNGGFKKWHCENTGEEGNIKRHLVFMTYLNDVEDGGTNFLYQNVITSAKKGLTLIWPSAWTHTHRGEVSKTKEKYIVTGWYSFIGEKND